MEKKRTMVIDNIIYLTRVGACGSPKRIKQADANTQTTTKTSTSSTSRAASYLKQTT